MQSWVKPASSRAPRCRTRASPSAGCNTSGRGRPRIARCAQSCCLETRQEKHSGVRGIRVHGIPETAQTPPRWGSSLLPSQTQPHTGSQLGSCCKTAAPVPQRARRPLPKREKMFFPYEKQLAGRADAQRATASAVIRGETRGQEAPRCPATGLLPLSPRHAVLPHFSFYLTSVLRGSSLILLLFLYSSAHVVLHKTFRERAVRASAGCAELRQPPRTSPQPGDTAGQPLVCGICVQNARRARPQKLHVGLGDQPARSSMRLLSQRGKKIKNKGLTSFI